MSSDDEQSPGPSSGAGPLQPEHHDDGLELAKALTRASARSTPASWLCTSMLR